MLNPEKKARRVAKLVAEGQHRSLIGGLWEEMGELQLAFLQARGLRPNDVLLDVGCGCLRGGVKLVRYLDAGNYYGMDQSADLIKAGYDVELRRAGLADKVPRANLVVDGTFDVARFDQIFDVAIAQSVFTHLPLNHVRQCLERLAPAMRPGGVFYATIFRCPDDWPLDQPIRRPANISTTAIKDPYHYRVADCAYAAEGQPWRFEWLGEWRHPRGQEMAAFHRL